MRPPSFAEIAAEMGGVTKALAAMGFNRKKDKMSLAARLSTHQKVALVAQAIERPEWGAVRVANTLRAKGVVVSPQAVRSAWYEYDLADIAQRWRAQRRSRAIDRFWHKRLVMQHEEGTSNVRQARAMARIQTITLVIMGLAGLLAFGAIF